MYEYPIDETWSTQEIIDVIALYNMVEKAYEEGVNRDEFMKAYRRFCEIVDAKSEQKRIDRAFEKASGYSIYRVFKACQKGDEHIHL